MIMRRHGGGFWVAAIVVLATFVAEPGASLDFTSDAFKAVGEFGGSLVVEIMSDDDSGGIS